MAVWFRITYKKKIKRMGQLCQSKTKEKEISSSCLAIYSFVSLTTHTKKTAEVIGEVSHSSILYLHLPIYIATSSHVQTISPPSVTPPHTIGATAAAPTQGWKPQKSWKKVPKRSEDKPTPKICPNRGRGPRHYWCCFLKDCVPQNLHAEFLTAQCDVFGGGKFRRSLGHKGGAFMTGTGALYEESWERGSLNSAMWRYS